MTTNDPRLSYRARGLLAHLREQEPGTPIDSRDLAQPEHREGRDAIRATLRELATAGHITTRKVQDKTTGRWSTVTVLVPQDGNPQVAPGTDSPAPVKPSVQVSPRTENPAPVHPAPENPFPANTEFPQVSPETDSPAPENPALSTCSPFRENKSPTSVVAVPRAKPKITPAELNATAVRPDAYRLVSTWNTTLTVPLRAQQQRELAKVLDGLLTEGAQLPHLRTALDDWATRGRTPAFLRNCYDDATQAARAAQDFPRPHMPARVPQAASGRGAKVEGWLALGQQAMNAQAIEPRPFGVIEGGRTA